jgi:hypothetical protein
MGSSFDTNYDIIVDYMGSSFDTNYDIVVDYMGSSFDTNCNIIIVPTLEVGGFCLDNSK